MEIVLDNTDLQILQLMQENARISNVDMAKKLDMAPSAVLERVKKLEQKKVIRNYTTSINPAAVGQKLLAFIFIKTNDGFGSSVTGPALAKIPEVQEVHNIAGEDCYLVKVRAADSAHLMSLMRNEFAKIPTIHSTKTTIVLETVKEEQKLVVPNK
ncbi:MAG TPA: Lrp/AsnC family transcriptional regulator [Puia sp.]|jgi:Lrp/AsnC family leucine-responsive transcriptional regulator|nr:Lrp/AsnC family transcriptional regulator [Puia sp.]